MNKQEIKFTNRIKTPFTWVENDIIRSKSLSAEEIGLYVILRSFGESLYPSMDYLAALTKMKKKKLYACLKTLIISKLLIRKQTKKGKIFSKVEYRILSFTDNYEEIYKEFIGKEPKNHINPRQYLIPERGVLRHAQIRHALNDHTLYIEEKELLKEKEPHTQKEKENVCEIENEKIKKLKLFQNSDKELIEKIIKKNGKEAVIAAEYIEKKFSGQTVKNPLGLLIRTLERGIYSELLPERINNLNAEIDRLNAKYKGFKVYRNEKIKEFLNIGGRVAFNTDNCLRKIVYTPTKSYEEFKKYLQKINSS